MQGPRHPSHSAASMSLSELRRAVEAGPSGSKSIPAEPEQQEPGLQEPKGQGHRMHRKEPRRLARIRKVLRRHLKFLGPGIVASSVPSLPSRAADPS